MAPPAIFALLVDLPAAPLNESPPPQRNGGIRRSIERSLYLTIWFAILTLLKLEPIAHTSVQNHNTDTTSFSIEAWSTHKEDSATVKTIPEISPLDLFVPLPLSSEVTDSIPSNFQFQERNSANSTPPSIWFDALDTLGHTGYVADPTLLRRSVIKWYKDHSHATYWDRLQNYQSHLLKNRDTSSDSFQAVLMEQTCRQVPGMSIFNHGGLTLLTKRIKVDKVPTIRMGGKGCLEQDENPDNGGDENSTNTNNKKKLKLFCGVYTHDGKRDSARIAALSYGWKCDGFLAFSTATIPSLGMVALLHRGEESYANMFQKSRSILSYVAMNYLDDYDYFHLAGDDMHMIVENFRSLMLEYETEGYSGTKQGRMFGQHAKKGGGAIAFSGGPGYTFDRIGLKKLFDYMPKCGSSLVTYAEDVKITTCVRSLNLEWSDNRDKCTGQQRSHDQHPDIVYGLAPGPGPLQYEKKQVLYWATLYHPTKKGQKVGLQVGFDAVSNHSVTFHRLRHPVWMTRHHALIYGACNASTPLGNLTGVGAGY